MIQSMTGFGKAQAKDKHVLVDVETRSLNNRYTEIRVFGLKDMLEVEHQVIAMVKKKFHRGKFDLNVKVSTHAHSKSSDEERILKHHKNLRLIAKKINLESTLDFATVLKTLPQKEPNKKFKYAPKSILQAASKALQNLEKSRIQEGKHLLQDIQKRALKMTKEIKAIEKRAKNGSKQRFKELKSKIQGMVGSEDLDKHRLEFEVALLVDKSDVTEELVRLAGHFSRFQKITASKSSVKGIGRKLDFLIQEINREINTIGSKISDVDTTETVVNLKSELEKIREQVQNIE